VIGKTFEEEHQGAMTFFLEKVPHTPHLGPVQGGVGKKNPGAFRFLHRVPFLLEIDNACSMMVTYHPDSSNIIAGMR
ncbi:MAG: hypothetical protein DRR04_13780, partial [Gammaproteobacteria bacterium]